MVVKVAHGVGYLLLLMQYLSCTGAGAATLYASKMHKLVEVRKHLRKLNKPALKTIQSPDGDIIDCVHISHQPAFDHPLLKDHKIQMRPNYHPKRLYDDKKMSGGTKESVNSMAQLWHVNGKCPIDTIPIRRTKKDDVMRASSVKMFGKKTNRSIPKHRSLYPDLVDQSDPDPGLLNDQSDQNDQSYPDLLNDQSDQDPDLVDQSDPSYPDLLNDQSDQDPDLIDQSDQDPDLINDQSDQDPNLPNLNDQSDQDHIFIDKSIHEYTIAQVFGDYYGATAAIDIWKPNVQHSDEFSLTQIWIVGGSHGDLNSIEAGWQVLPHLYGDTNPRLFTYWTNDAYKTTGCYNLVCSGFVQTSNNIAVGSTLSPYSEYSGPQYDMSILIWKDTADGNWWLKFGDEYLGYWPSSMFSYLSKSASNVQWGGEIINSRSNVEHTSTEMGSGHFPKDGYYGKSSYVRNMQVVDSSIYLKAPEGLQTLVSNSNCYNIDIQQTSDDERWGHYFYYGGSGRNLDCI